MAREKKRVDRKLDPFKDYVLKSKLPEDPSLMNFYTARYVSAYHRGVQSTKDFSKAIKFNGRWLNDTCW